MRVAPAVCSRTCTTICGEGRAGGVFTDVYDDVR
jgi:hypothetical protein